MTPHIIARCPKCYGEVLANGVCPVCAPPEESLQRLRMAILARGKLRPEKRVKAKPAKRAAQESWWPDKARETAAAQQELPPGDRMELA
jgi:hypothetical protein